MADERHTNAAKAEALIAEAVAETAALVAAGTVDWKHLASSVQRLRLAWSHLGAIDRKDKKRLDQAFTDALNVMQAPLEQQRKDEVAVREELIARVAALNPADRHTLDTLKALQERWQEHARALPLERKSEQALWQRFRAACDAVFAKRKETAHAADAERRQHQHAKEAVCVRLEEAAAAADAASALASCCARRPPNGMPSALSRAPTKPASTSAIRPLSRRCSTISTAPGATPGVPRPPRCATSCTCARRSRDNWPTARPIRPPPTGTRWAALLSRGRRLRQGAAGAPAERHRGDRGQGATLTPPRWRATAQA
ncbi:DUF349 domain-containing protein [Massilia sp. B-10]|nr:DUF349 domain-containing protein [Massilia sp. B-10]